MLYQAQPALVSPPVRVRPFRAALILVFASMLALIIPRVGNVYVHALVSAMLLCCVAPAWFAWQAGRLDAFETVHLVGLIYFVYFGLGALWSLNDPVRVAYDIYLVPFIPQATLYCLLGYFALLAGYFGPWFRGQVRRPWEEIPQSVVCLVLPGVAGIVGSFAEAAWSHSRWLGSTFPIILSSLAQLSPLFLFTWALAWLLILSGRATRSQRIFSFGFLVPGTVAIALASLTDKSLVMTLLGVPVIALWYARGKLPWKTLIALLLLLVFVVFPVYNTFRLLEPRLAWTARIAMTGELMGGWDLEQYRRQTLEMVQRRLALINSVAVVLRDVPRWVPYEHGATLFMPAVAFFIPRVLWPDKPTFTMGRDFAEIFRVVHMLDTETRVSVTVPGELYWNFDLPGILLGMALWGIALRFFYRRYGAGRTLDPVRKAIHIILLVQFVHFGGGIAAQAVAVARILVVLELLRWVGRRTGALAVAANRES